MMRNREQSGWEAACHATECFLKKKQRSDYLMEGWNELPDVERRRAFRLLYGWLRYRGVFEAVFKKWMRKVPKPQLKAILELGAYEVWASEESRRAKVVHGVVERAKKVVSGAEVKLLNAILRRMLREPEVVFAAIAVSVHPKWLRDRLILEYGEAAYEALARWDLEESSVYIRSGVDLTTIGCEAAEWPEFYRLGENADWSGLNPLLSAGEAYIQDPFTTHPVKLLGATAGEHILDLCAAPGGKSRALWDQAQGALAQLVAVDLPGNRIGRLRENLAPLGERAKIIEADILSLNEARFRDAGSVTQFDGVLLDVPCSNTGVMQRRPDVRWLLTEKQVKELRELQWQLLKAAASWVKPGGRLVYSTCSLGQNENIGIVNAFLAEHSAFTLVESKISLPWMDHHDGGGAFLLTRKTAES